MLGSLGVAVLVLSLSN